MRGFPNDAVDSDLVILLENSGMPKYHKDLAINRNPFNATVDIENLSHSNCLELLKNIDGTTYGNKIVKVKGILDAKVKPKEVAISVEGAGKVEDDESDHEEEDENDDSTEEEMILKKG